MIPTMAEIEDKTSKNLFQIDTEDSPISAVIDFLDTHLKSFPSDFTKRTSKPDEIKENLISQQLDVFLDRRSRDEVFRFKYQWEYLDSDRNPDFGIYIVEDRNPFGFTQAFFEIEAKKLPTGSRDYVKGKQGGVERFKRGFHGKDLPQSAIVGYIQAETCSHWHTEINKWIDDLISSNTDTTILWDSSDLLVEISDFGKTRKYNSKNTCIVDSKRDSIELHHYLMELN